MIQVDPVDEPLLAARRWRLNAYGYVVAGGGNDVRFLHREILIAPSGLEVDHINGDPLDNRRANLRLVTHAQQQQNLKLRADNQSGHRGVSFDRSRSQWVAQGKCGRRRLHRRCGSLEEAVEAARAWRAENMTHAVER